MRYSAVSSQVNFSQPQPVKQAQIKSNKASAGVPKITGIAQHRIASANIYRSKMKVINAHSNLLVMSG